MPSPVAHAGLALFARPLLARQPVPPRRRWLFYSLLVLTLCVPDLDFIFAAVFDPPRHQHGAFMHSLTAAIVFAPLFAGVARVVLKRTLSWTVLLLVGGLAYSSHLVMDLLTPGRGIMLLWPISTERIVSPLPLFVGVQHSQPWAWRLHLITLASELAFVGVVWLVVRGCSAQGRWMSTMSA